MIRELFCQYLILNLLLVIGYISTKLLSNPLLKAIISFKQQLKIGRFLLLYIPGIYCVVFSFKNYYVSSHALILQLPLIGAVIDHGLFTSLSPSTNNFSVLDYFYISLFIAIIAIFISKIMSCILQLIKLHRLINESICIRRRNNLSIVVSDTVSTPFCFSFLRRSYIVITQELLEDCPHYQLAIKHEINHLRQKDTCWIYLFEIFKAIFYFNPIVRIWLKYNLECQEFSCDESLIKEKSILSEDYANCLLTASEQAQRKEFLSKETYSAAVGLFHSKKSLMYRRISMLYEYKKIPPKPKLLLSIGILLSLLIATTTYAISDTMRLQIIKQQINLTNQSFKSAQLAKCSDDNCTVQVELTPEATNLIHNFTASNINSTLNLVWQGRIISSPVIQSPLGAHFEMTGFTKEQANEFVKEMKF